MQIHELSRRRTDEGVGSWLKGAGKAAGAALGKATGITDPNAPAKSAGILDPAAKLAAVRKNSAMTGLATQLAKEWVAQAPAAKPAAKPLPEAVTASGGATAAELSALDARIAAAAAAQPGATPQAAAPQGTAATPPGDPATAKYLKDFLAYANQKTAIRDPSTYQMIGLNQIIYQSGLKAELDKAKARVLAAYEAGQDVTAAAADYILTAMAGAQLIMSKNKAGVGPTPAGDVAPAAGATPPAATPAPTEFLSVADVQGLFKLNNIDSVALTKLGTELQRASGTNTVNRTGNGTVDNMLRTLGFKVK